MPKAPARPSAAARAALATTASTDPIGDAPTAAADPGADTGGSQDGRHARRDRNRYAVVDAYLELVREGDPRPSIAAVAERSGVSHRSVFRYFADKDELARTAIERQQAFASPLVPLTVGPGAPLDERIERFVERRLELFSAIAPVARLSRSLAPTQAVLDEELRSSRSFLRGQLRHLFRAELEVMDEPQRAIVLAALDALCSFEAVDLMRRDQGLSGVQTAAALRFAIRRLLTD